MGNADFIVECGDRDSLEFNSFLKKNRKKEKNKKIEHITIEHITFCITKSLKRQFINL